jgi:hypothetical protein
MHNEKRSMNGKRADALTSALTLPKKKRVLQPGRTISQSGFKRKLLFGLVFLLQNHPTKLIDIMFLVTIISLKIFSNCV